TGAPTRVRTAAARLAATATLAQAYECAWLGGGEPGRLRGSAAPLRARHGDQDGLRGRSDGRPGQELPRTPRNPRLLAHTSAGHGRGASGAGADNRPRGPHCGARGRGRRGSKRRRSDPAAAGEHLLQLPARTGRATGALPDLGGRPRGARATGLARSPAYTKRPTRLLMSPSRR